MVRSRSFSALPTFAALTVATGLIIGCGTANAGHPDERWGVTLKGPDKESLDPKIKTWTLQLFDAVSCEKLSPANTIAKSGSVKLTLLAREGAGSATKGQLGAHFRWQVSGMAPNPRGPGPTKMFFWGEPKPTKKGAEITIVISADLGTAKPHDIGKSAGCDKALPASSAPKPTGKSK
jgi:hypothetical protein